MGAALARPGTLFVLGALLVVGLGGCAGTSTTQGSTTQGASNSATAAPTTATDADATLGGSFARATPLPATVSCTYPAASEQAAKPSSPPPTTGISARGTAAVTLATTVGDIGLTLDRALSPCTVNNFLSLSKQDYFDTTSCHRLVTSGIFVLQCGDPTGTGKGGPGYVFANEYPTDQYPATNEALTKTVNYPAGTVAMANTGNPNTNGSQFFLVYHDSPLPPRYTVFGTIDAAGLRLLTTVAANGLDKSAGAATDGSPKTAVTINAVRITS